MKTIENYKLINYYLNKYELSNFINKDLLQSIKLEQFNPGEFICTFNEDIHNIYFLVQGKAKVFTVSPNGKSLLLCFNTPLSLMGDIEVINNPKADCNVQALEDTYCLAIPFDRVRKYGLNDPIFLKFIITNLGEKLRKNTAYSSINMLYPLENRFASYLISILPSSQHSVLSVEIEGVNHIAELLGSSYRHLNRVIHNLSAKNIISKEKNIIKILDIKTLNTLVDDVF